MVCLAAEEVEVGARAVLVVEALVLVGQAAAVAAGAWRAAVAPMAGAAAAAMLVVAAAVSGVVQHT